jgi:predicted TIM-barrel fold metal-dependent hydrolase
LRRLIQDHTMSEIIDIHPHIVSPDTQRYPLAPLGGKQSAWSSERPTTYEQLLQAMDGAEVAKAAIVHSSTAYGYDNSYVADAVAAVPSRFTGVYSIDVLAPDAVKTFDDWLARGCSGMRLFTTGSTLPDQATWFADPRTFPFWEHAAAKNIPVCMQMKQQGIPLLRHIMDRFPKVTMILDHLSRTPFEDGPPYDQAADFLALAKYDQVYLKVTPINVTPKSWGKGAPGTFFAKVIATFGASRIAWGSNFPNSVGTLAEILAAAREAFSFASDSDREWIFGRTAQTLYPALADGRG